MHYNRPAPHQVSQNQALTLSADNVILTNRYTALERLMAQLIEEKVKKWFEKGKASGTTHLICVWMATGEDQHFPVYVMPGQNPRAKAYEFGGDGDRRNPDRLWDEVLAVFSLSRTFEEQWAEVGTKPVFNFD